MILYGYVYLEKLRRFCEILGNKRFTTTFWVFSPRHFGQYISKYALSMYITKTMFFVHWFNYTFTIHTIFSLFVLFKEWRYKIFVFLYSTFYITLDIAYDTSLLHIDIFLLGMIFLLPWIACVSKKIGVLYYIFIWVITRPANTWKSLTFRLLWHKPLHFPPIVH